MTNGEKIQTILDVDRDCTEVYGENGTMTFTVTQDFWNADYKEQKTGYWYYDEEREATGIYAICSNCDEKIYQTGDFKFCPNCGAKMVEPQESEEKE